MDKFSTLPLSSELLANIASLDYQHMTPIQAQSLPLILQGKDVLAQAKTGSGKTAAFGIGLLHRINLRNAKTQALIVCPTRELAEQVSNEIRRLARFNANTRVVSLCGGKPLNPQLATLEHNPHIVVGTPGRLLKHIEKQSLNLSHLKTLVLDEADRMLDMGFYDDIMKLIDQTPQQRQTLLFSATYPEAIRDISDKIQINPQEIRVESQHDNTVIKQVFYEIEKGERCKTLVALLQHYRPETSLIFCNRKQQCQELAEQLWQQGFHALALHGDLEQQERDQVVLQFTHKSTSIVVATDVAARGLDIKDLPMVINYELSPDPDTYLHRIGRTGRAGNIGIALSLFMASESPKLNAIESKQNTSLRIEKSSSLKTRDYVKLIPPMVTLSIYGGRKEKIRAGDVLGALTASKQLLGNQIGRISIGENLSYVAVARPLYKQALKILTEDKIKGRKFKIRKLR